MTRASTRTPWMDPADVVAVLRRRWTSGELLRRHASGADWEPLAVPLRGPTAADLAADLTAVRQWASRWAAAPHVRVETRMVGGRAVGANAVPARVWIDSPAACWSLLGVRRDIGRLDALLAVTAERLPGLLEWVSRHPRRALDQEAIWPRLLDVVAWVRDHDGGPVYLRQVDVAGVDTKFLERHRGVLAELLDVVLPASRVHRAAARSDLVARYGFRAKPELLRLRTLDPRVRLPGGFTDLAAPADELGARPAPVESILVVENETTYLALPEVPGAVAVLGGGYGVAARLVRLGWVAESDVAYWGDLDTHGLAILHEARKVLPRVRSILMDRETLVDHRAHWTREPAPTRAELPLLTESEREVYDALRQDTYGMALRLEQERIRFSAVAAALAARR